MKRARLLAFLLDVLVAAAVADAGGFLATAVVWWGLPFARQSIPWIWASAGALAVALFLLRDARGGRARRWLGLEAVRGDGGVPGAARSIRRNLPLLIPGWNLLEALPVLRDGSAPRRSDLKTGIQIRRSD
ncbi:MAG TPA: hypothetical protein VE007_12445 [Thermoanaerobaculia bacterium]|nr:hypothetical protein [Thermoanaerobaculia bacterium]